jgi:hypothetical protein
MFDVPHGSDCHPEVADSSPVEPATNYIDHAPSGERSALCLSVIVDIPHLHFQVSA